MSNKINILLAFYGILIFAGIICCKRNCKEFEIVINPNSERPPLIKITGKDSSKCVYQAYVYIMLKDCTIDSRGELFLKNDAFYLNVKDPSINNLRYFDFKKSLNEDYTIPITILDKKYSIKASVEEIVNWKEGIEVYVFRFQETYYYLDRPLDVILLCSKENGILGSYLTTYENENKILIAPGGEILKDYIDYSDYKIRYLK
ncbi:MAG: hypothetical protein HOD63_14365 [Bacteroidetes bacterium]|jgi:hypothetical protein|nr:hypothetical protein [Bacteroidota bacterium]MBT5529107.1 hypothetical protein [Cytophagia bacterium]MBT3421916.1 hypothetical protein [Bacteroidota bacterium]MBT3802265.1 hypothetical protein [Bacteroidota bacterium]MBT4339772.1 hypothetical protein [Bacteroidota bacterium]